MKIIADVETVNRLLPSVSLKSRGRTTRAQICLGRKGPSTSSADDRETALLVCTQQDRNGTKYKLKGNIEQVFAKFIREGKCTLRLREPPIDLCISKADPLQLKSFLTILHAASTGKNIEGVTLAPLAAATTKQVAKMKTKLVISRRSEYPITSSFPPALESLAVHDCSLLRIDSRIMRLDRLVSLDLSNNRIATLPDDWSAFTALADLRLAHNNLVHLPAGLSSSRVLCQTLAHLDVSHNHLKSLRQSLYDLAGLAVLKVDSNELESISAGISRLARLVCFTAAGNRLQSLPGDFDRLTLQSLDLFGNPLTSDGPSTIEVVDDGELPSLFEFAGRCIRNKRVPYSADEVGRRNAEYLDSAQFCWRCRQACMAPHARCRRRVDLRRVSASVVNVDTNGRTYVPCDDVLCSPACAVQFANAL